jgi:hypothetical protein
MQKSCPTWDKKLVFFAQGVIVVEHLRKGILNSERLQFLMNALPMRALPE